MRIHLKFEREAKVKETGGVSVEVGDSASIADVYRRAHAGEFAEFLIADREYSNEKWEFEILKEEENNDETT